MATESDHRMTAAIVLGGGMKKVIKRQGQIEYEEYEPEERVKKRLDKAYQLLEEGKVDYIVTTGRYSKRVGVDPRVIGPKTEAEVSKQYLQDTYKIDDNRILYENQSYDTIGNAWFAKKVCLELFNIVSCKIITSDFHMERSMLIFEWVLGPDYAVEPVPVESQMGEKDRAQRERLENVFIEYMKTHLLGSIAPGDNQAIERFIENEHLRYCLSDRSEAMLHAYIMLLTSNSG
jgi:uncharacterized SAM-binding protein YcdF (DUF218 family)